MSREGIHFKRSSLTFPSPFLLLLSFRGAATALSIKSIASKYAILFKLKIPRIAGNAISNSRNKKRKEKKREEKRGNACSRG